MFPVGEAGVDVARRRTTARPAGVDVAARVESGHQQLDLGDLLGVLLSAPLSAPRVDDLRYVRMADDRGPEIT